MPGLYLGLLLASIGGLALLDFRWKLALWDNWRRTSATIGVGVVWFLLWDLLGIWRGIFFEGSGDWLVGIKIAPQVPLEEPVFLTLMCYQALVIYLAIGRAVAKRRRA
jgi:lycopene cyclase domain-containing protein